jgi:hypothetical protein
VKRILICILALGLGAGCSDDDPVKPQQVPPVRTTPKASAEYYRLAWQSRDSTRIDSVLADDYQGTSIDMGSTTETLTFTKSDEIRAVHNMKDDQNLVSVSVDFGPQNYWRLDSHLEDPPEWVVVIIDNPYIRLSWASADEVFVSPNSTSEEFKLRPLASGPDTTWEIVRWKEVHTSP